MWPPFLACDHQRASWLSLRIGGDSDASRLSLRIGGDTDASRLSLRIGGDSDASRLSLRIGGDTNFDSTPAHSVPGRRPDGRAVRRQGAANDMCRRGSAQFDGVSLTDETISS
jgi:hypothetical protein